MSNVDAPEPQTIEELEKKLTPKQLTFARAIGIKKEPLIAAYKAAYNTSSMKQTTVNRESIRLSKHSTIAPLIDLYLGEAKAEDRLSREMIINQLILNAKDAHTAQDFTASNKALELLGKVDTMALFVERKQVESDNRHHHSAGPVSAYHGFLTEIAGEPPEEPSAEPVPDGSVRPAEIRSESS